jgi:hypothetical protein
MDPPTDIIEAGDDFEDEVRICYLLTKSGISDFA